MTAPQTSVLTPEKQDQALTLETPPLLQNLEQLNQMASAASRGLMAHPKVESALVEIAAEGEDLVFHLRCVIKQDHAADEVMDTVVTGIIPNIERLLDTRFATRYLRFDVAP